LERYQVDSRRRRDGTEVQPLLPDKFKDAKQYAVFKESLTTYLSQIRGITGVPLTYVVRSLEAPEPGAEFPDAVANQVANAPLRGAVFSADNSKVYQIIKQLTLEGPGWAWVQASERTANGRQAYTDLMAHYEGPSNKSRLIDEYTESIQSKLVFHGNKNSFTFERYVTLLQAAHQQLERLGSPMPQRDRVKYFLRNIKDQRLNSAITQVMATEALRDNFVAAVNFVSSFTHDQDLINFSRNVSTVNAGGRGDGPGRGGRGGRGGGRGGGGRGRGRGNDKSKGKPKVEGRSYPYSEWRKLTPEQQAEVRRLRALKEGGGGDKKRNLSSATKEAPKQESDESDGSAGGQFGPNAHGKKRRSQGRVVSSTRRNGGRSAQTPTPRIGADGRADLDSHADTCCVNNVARVLEITERVCLTFCLYLRAND
jgi:hypothetical protein